MADPTINNSQKPGIQRWKNAVAKFKQATVLEKYTPGKLDEELIDCVRVRIVQSIEAANYLPPYLEEIATAKHTRNSTEYDMLRMTQDELKQNQLFYDASSKKLVDLNNNTATTLGKESKGTKNLQAFVMSKDGSLYYSTHKGTYDKTKPNLTHASFLSGKPLEMAGMISINQNGKINFLSDNSGHYAPEPIDMYRGIKRLQILMPDAIDPNCKIQLLGPSGNYEQKVTEFLSKMEEIQPSNKSYYQELRENRAKNVEQYTSNLKNATSIVLNTDKSNLPETLASLTTQEQQKLANGLSTPMANISIRNSGQPPKTFSIPEAVTSIVGSGNTDAMKVLLDNGISNRNDFHNTQPLDYAISSQNPAMVETLLSNKNIQQSLGNIHNRPSVLHTLAASGNSENNKQIVDKILQYPEGQKLLAVKDGNGYTPAQAASYYQNSQISDILIDRYKPIAQKQLIDYCTEQFKDKDVLTTKDKDAMKQKIVDILRPITSSHQEEQKLDKEAGTLVRKMATNMDVKLDFKQKLNLIKTTIKETFEKIFTNRKQEMFEQLTSKSNIKEALGNTKSAKQKTDAEQKNSATKNKEGKEWTRL